MTMFTVSVIVPNYNNEKYLRQCLDSILIQTYPIDEIIVYDDCSTDTSRDILKEYADHYAKIKVLFGEKNVGVSKARDYAILSTQSDYICMLDADDFFYDEYKIENEMQIIIHEYEKTGNKVISFSQTVDVDETGTPISEVTHVELSGNERFRIVTRAYSKYMPRDYCFPRELYNACGGYTVGLSLYEDWDLNIKLLQYTRFVYSKGYGTAYRHKPNGLSSVSYKKHLITKKAIFQKYNTSIKEKVAFYFFTYGAYVKNRLGG